MTEKVNPNLPPPSDLQSPLHRHASETVRSRNDAGGEVDRSQYAGKGPAPTRSA